VHDPGRYGNLHGRRSMPVEQRFRPRSEKLLSRSSSLSNAASATMSARKRCLSNSPMRKRWSAGVTHVFTHVVGIAFSETPFRFFTGTLFVPSCLCLHLKFHNLSLYFETP
jgi:hypothetical protein